MPCSKRRSEPSICWRPARGTESHKDSPGDRFDGSVLDAILRFGKVARTFDLPYELAPEDSEHESFVLDAHSYARVEARLKIISSPKAFVVSGKLRHYDRPAAEESPHSGIEAGHMSSQATERAFEAYVKAVLLEQGGWQRGTTAEGDMELALFPPRV